MNTAQSLVNLKMMSYKDGFLSDFVERFHDACSVRDACTRKYLMANHHEAIYNGLPSVDNFVGITLYQLYIEDVLNRKNKLNLASMIISNEENNIKEIEKCDDQLLLTKRPTSFNSIFVNFNGRISFNNINMIPIPGRNNKVIAFLTIFLSLTSQLSLDQLFQLYQKHYPRKKAIQKTLEHFGVDSYFNSCDLPTCTEMRVLLSMREDSRCKAVAQKFGLSVPTTSNYITNIQHKLKSSDLHNVLRKLRAIPVNQQSAMDSCLLS